MSDSYHINPNTGRANKCSAKISCRFGTNTEHYSSKEAAQVAYEASMSSETITQGLKKTSASIETISISEIKADEFDTKTRSVSGGVVGISPGNEFNGDRVIMGISFNCEHDLYLIIEKDKNGDKWGYVAYDYDPRPARIALDQILTPSEICGLAEENDNYPYDIWEDDSNTHTAGVEVVKIINDLLTENDDPRSS